MLKGERRVGTGGGGGGSGSGSGSEELGTRRIVIGKFVGFVGLQWLRVILNVVVIFYHCWFFSIYLSFFFPSLSLCVCVCVCVEM